MQSKDEPCQNTLDGNSKSSLYHEPAEPFAKQAGNAAELMTKTNAVRLLDSLGIFYEPRAYEVDPGDLVAETVAAKIGLPPK